MYPKSFEYHRPSSLAELLEIMESSSEENFKILAGGQSLIPILKLRLFEPSALIDITRISELKYVRIDPSSEAILRVGALTTHEEIAESELIRSRFPVLAAAAENVGDTQIRSLGTIGGSICHADPAGDYLPALLVLNASVSLRSRKQGKRIVPLQDFITGALNTSIDRSEVLDEVIIPSYEGVFAVEKFARRKADFAIANVAIILRMGSRSKGSIEDLRVAGGPLGDGAYRFGKIEKGLVGKQYSRISIEATVREAMNDPSLTFPSDLHGSSSYRREVMTGMISRMLKSLCENRGGLQ